MGKGLGVGVPSKLKRTGRMVAFVSSRECRERRAKQEEPGERPVTFVHRYRDRNSPSSVPEGPALSTVLSIFLRTVNTDDCQARMEKKESMMSFLIL